MKHKMATIGECSTERNVHASASRLLLLLLLAVCLFTLPSPSLAATSQTLSIDPFIQTELITSDGTRFNSFGPAVVISGDGNTVVVGAQNAFIGGFNLGAAYVFTRVGGVWTQQARLTVSDGAAFDSFGHAVGISGDSNTVVVGAPRANILLNNQLNND